MADPNHSPAVVAPIVDSDQSSPHKLTKPETGSRPASHRNSPGDRLTRPTTMNGNCSVVELSPEVECRPRSRDESSAAAAGVFPALGDDSPDRKLILHFDIRNTILVFDSLTKDDVEQALNSFLAGVTWGRHLSSSLPACLCRSSAVAASAPPGSVSTPVSPSPRAAHPHHAPPLPASPVHHVASCSSSPVLDSGGSLQQNETLSTVRYDGRQPQDCDDDDDAEDRDDSRWVWCSDRPSLRSPCPEAITYYKRLEARLIRSASSDRVMLV